MVTERRSSGGRTSGRDHSRRVTKVLVANRGEIAVRVIRACKDAGIASVAVYAEPDRHALHVELADEAHALGGTTSAESYLRADLLLEVAARSGADAVHPGYGFLSEDSGFARAVVDAGLTWIGPPPAAIEALGDKVSAREIAEKVGAPLVAGTPGPVSGVDEVLAFVDQHGLPVAIKAAYGGGGRGLKVARSREEVGELYESAVREAVAAFGRGECFVERYLDEPRHVETQCLADEHGGVVVVSTRDCSLQRRHQKLVEEAPAPFLTPEQERSMRDASKAILREAGYVGAGTCEFLVAKDGTVSFLEVNTRLQVEHPVTEEVTGLDLVREQFRLATGEPLGYDDPPARGHSFEFRINGEDPGRGFLPAPGTVSRFEAPSGPGVRVDAGIRSGDVISGAFDSLLAKLVVTGATREQALQRARRALAEMAVEGMPTVLPFHRLVVDDPAFTAVDPSLPAASPAAVGEAERFRVHTRWIETAWSGSTAPWSGPAPEPAHADDAERSTVVVEVAGKRLEVTLPGWVMEAGAQVGGAVQSARRQQKRPRNAAAAAKAAGGDALVAPMQGTLVKVAVEEGQTVVAGDLVVVLEAMKMEQPLTAHKDGVVTGLKADVGATLTTGAVICTIKDAAAS